MSVRLSAMLGALLLVLAVVPAAEARAAKPRLAQLGSLPAAVAQGSAVRAKGRVTNLPRRRSRSARLTFSLRPRAGTSGRPRRLRSVKLRRTKTSRTRRFSVRLRIPATAAPGRHSLRACVTRAKRKSCRARRLRVTQRPGAPGVPGTPANPGSPGPGGSSDDGLHSLRAAETDQNFYFVMADRFENGSAANDDGGLRQQPRDVSGFDPSARATTTAATSPGLLKRIDYIHDLGTTAIWLTPSFKNKAVQPEDGSAAGYHGYWITDFTQIDPHLGTNAELERAGRRRARARHEALLRHHHQPHRRRDPATTEGARGRATCRRTSRPTGRRPARRSTTATSPGAQHASRALAADRRASPTTRSTRRASEHAQGPGLAQRRHAVPQPRQHDVRRRELALRRLLRARRPLHREPAGRRRA